MKLKRYLSAIIIAVTALVLLVGCDDSSSTYGRENKVTALSARKRLTRKRDVLIGESISRFAYI